MNAFASHCLDDSSWKFYLIGDERSPRDFYLEGCDFYDLARQKDTGFRFAAGCPTGHYARKNLGYLLAIRDGCDLILETDDDNLPLPGFWDNRTRNCTCPRTSHAGWLNVYRYFSDSTIWPRGLPLDAIHSPIPDFHSMPEIGADCPIQQGLVDRNPDVDAIYRLVLPLPIQFAGGRRLALGAGSWCPINSQNTAWWPAAYPLLYLPAFCSFRMTDIWRGFVAQRIAWENGWSILFHSPNAEQERNEHSLIRDFEQEVPGYLNNHKIVELLERTNLRSGVDGILDNLVVCYEALVRGGFIGQAELLLLGAWCDDLRALAGNCGCPDSAT
jgi:hypothetical protein